MTKSNEPNSNLFSGQASVPYSSIGKHFWITNWITGLLRAVALRYRYCSGATFTVAVAVAPLLLVEKNGDGSAATFSPVFRRYALPLLLSTDN